MKALQLPAHLLPPRGTGGGRSAAAFARRVRVEQAYVDERLSAGATLATVLGREGRRVHTIECPYARDYLDRAGAWARARARDDADEYGGSSGPGLAVLLTVAEFQAHVKVVYKRCQHCLPPVPEARRGAHVLRVRAKSIEDHHVGSHFTGPDGTDLGELVSFRHYTVVTTSRGTINLPADVELIYEKPTP